MTANRKLVIQKGCTLDEKYRWLSAGVAVKLGGYKFLLQVRASYKDDADLLLDLSTDNGGILTTDADEGRFRLNMSWEETAALTWDEGVYTLEYEIGDIRKALLAGRAVALPTAIQEPPEEPPPGP